MNGSDQEEIYVERLNKLKTFVAREFPRGRFEVKYEPTISVSLFGIKGPKQRVPRIEFSLTEEFMTDLDNDFEEISNQGIALAKTILENPPSPNRKLQGGVVLDNGGAAFQRRE